MGYIVFAFPFVRSYVRTRPHILKTLRWISFIFGMMVDIGLKFLSAPSPSGGDLWVKVKDLELKKKSKFFLFKFI